jgi:hypothetical protein
MTHPPQTVFAVSGGSGAGNPFYFYFIPRPQIVKIYMRRAKAEGGPAGRR